MSTDTGAPRLPGGFRDLERWVEKWVCADSQARSDERQATPFDEIKAFYDAMLPQAVAALAHLSNY
nr:hypothetical protein [Gammaproteobacteria bacterium]